MISKYTNDPPPDPSQQYLEQARQVIGEVSEVVLTDLGRSAVYAAEYMTYADALGKTVSEGTESYLADHGQGKEIARSAELYLAHIALQNSQPLPRANLSTVGFGTTFDSTYKVRSSSLPPIPPKN